MSSFKHAHIIVSTDFELEPVIEQYLATYPEAQPRKYDIVCKLRNERHEGDYCYIIVYQHHVGRQTPSLDEYLKSYCALHDEVVAGSVGGHVFPELEHPRYGNGKKYSKK